MRTKMHKSIKIDHGNAWESQYNVKSTFQQISQWIMDPVYMTSAVEKYTD